jgi:hypothetical protein
MALRESFPGEIFHVLKAVFCYTIERHQRQAGSSLSTQMHYYFFIAGSRLSNRKVIGVFFALLTMNARLGSVRS